MTKRVLGLYTTVKETRDAIAVFELSGHLSKNVVIFANNIDDSTFEYHQTVNLDSNKATDDDKQGFIEKVKETFTTHDVLDFDTPEKLVEYGLSEDEAAKAIAGVRNGYLVVIVDDELRMGNS